MSLFVPSRDGGRHGPHHRRSPRMAHTANRAGAVAVKRGSLLPTAIRKLGFCMTDELNLVASIIQRSAFDA